MKVKWLSLCAASSIFFTLIVLQSGLRIKHNVHFVMLKLLFLNNIYKPKSKENIKKNHIIDGFDQYYVIIIIFISNLY